MDTFSTEDQVLNELRRLEALHALHLLDTRESADLDRIIRFCTLSFDAPGAYISLIDANRQRIKSCFGIPMSSTSREESFCHHTITQRAVMVIEDSLDDPRFRYSPLVTAAPHIRFYAGAPLITPDGFAIGALCIIGTAPRKFSEAERTHLALLAEIAMSNILLRQAVVRVDMLTGLPNKYKLMEDLDAMARLPSRLTAGYETSACRTLAYIDMPDSRTAFEIASVLGTEFYDDLIRNVGDKLRQLTTGWAEVYYLNESRFALLESPHNVGQKIPFKQFLHDLTRLLEQPITSMMLPLNLPSYGGIVSINLQHDAIRDAPRKAVSALHEAFSHNQRWSEYDAAADTRHQRSFRLLNDIPEAIRSGTGFTLVYQPKLDLCRNTYLSAEVLLRWEHAELGAISPAEFIPLVERTALIKPLSDWVIKAAFEQLAAWRDAGVDLKLSINLSPQNFEEEDLVERLERACRESDISPDMIEIECTEGIWMEHPGVLNKLHDIRKLGMELALDDFGTGYSNFSYLQEVPASVVKIDKSLIRRLPSSLRDQRIVQSLISLAKELDYRIVAEGVESEQTLQILKKWEIDEAQGYHLARPMSAQALVSHMRADVTCLL